MDRISCWVVIFAVAFAWVEASVVVYLRDLYYPDGFSFPLRTIDESRMGIELVREFSTLVMLAAAGVLAGRSRWQRFAHFAIAFGVWDIFFYFWLIVMIGWPVSAFDWDVLFLLPIPWIGPVYAPLIISIILVGAGLMILAIERRTRFRPPLSAWIGASTASIAVLWTFMRDTDAGLRAAMPEPYPHGVFAAAAGLYAVSIWLCWKKHLLVPADRADRTIPNHK